MATNQQITQAYQSLRTAFSTEVLPRMLAVGRQVGSGALWSEIESEVAAIRADLDSLYGQIIQFLTDARSNDPQDPDLIARLETTLNTNRANNFSFLAQLEQSSRGAEQQQVDRETEAQEDTAALDAGPGTASAGDIVAAAAAAREFLAQNPPVPAALLSRISGAVTNAVSSLPGLPAAPNVTPKLPGGSSPTSAAASGATAFTSTPAPGSLAFEPEDQPKTVEQSFVYRVTTVTSRFSRGRFEQDIEGTIVNFDDIVTTTNTQTVPNTQLTTPSETTRTATTQDQGRVTVGAVGNPGQVDFAGSEFGAYFGTGETGGAVNYTPSSLADVLDRKRGTNPLTSDLLGSEGFSDPTAVSQQESPTSNGQPVDQFAQTDPGEIPVGTTDDQTQLILRDD